MDGEFVVSLAYNMKKVKNKHTLSEILGKEPLVGRHFSAVFITSKCLLVGIN